MTIQTIETATPSTLLDDDFAVTRADVRDNAVRFFDGRRKVGDHQISLPATPEVVAGILAAMTFPTTKVAILDHLEASLEEVAERKGSVIPDGYRHGYGVDQNCGDDVAVVLKEYCGGGMGATLDLSLLEEVAAANGIRDRFDVWATKGLNNGMLRMNTGNVLRGMVRNEKPVRVGTKVWNHENFVGPMRPTA